MLVSCVCVCLARSFVHGFGRNTKGDCSVESIMTSRATGLTALHTAF